MRKSRVRTLGLAALCGCAVSAQLSAQEKVFEVEELAPGVWAALVVPRPPMYVFANALVIEQEDGLGVVDSHSSPSAARAMIRRIEMLSDKPVKWLVNTHFHADHVYGNGSYIKRFPDIRLIAHENTARDIEVEMPSFIAKEIAELPASIEQRREWIRTKKGPGGEDLTDVQIQGLERSARLRAGQLEELRTLDLQVPTETFAREMTLADDTRPVRLYHFGPAHTEGDAVVYLEDQKILAVGDLLEDDLPWVDQNTHPVGWADTLDELVELDIEVILPSHGGVYRDTDHLRRQQKFFRYIVNAVREGYDRGDTVEDVRAGINAADVPKPLEEGHRSLQSGWAAYVDRVIGHTYRDLSGGG